MHCKSVSMAMASLHSEWILICLLFFLITVTPVRNMNIEKLKSERDMTIDEYINHVNPPSVHKFKNEDGDNILCVRFADQISLQGSEQRFVDTGEDQQTMSGLNFSSTGCPTGTVPIIETKREDVERAGSVSRYISKSPGSVRRFINKRNGIKQPEDNNTGHEYAVVRYESLEPINAVSAGLNVWQPNVVTSDNGIFSLCQIWLVNQRNQLETIEVGWIVHPTEYNGDPQTRLFIYWTSDSYGYTGCWNLKCRGFVLAKDVFLPPGGVLKPVSTYKGEQRQISVNVVKESPNDGLRWALYIAGKLIGWWPGTLFKNLHLQADWVDFGGEVAYLEGDNGSQFTKTDMGSGYFAKGGFGRAAHVRNIQITGNNGAPVDAPPHPIVGRPQCYDISFPADNDMGTHIFYGGPGGDNEGCVF